MSRLLKARKPNAKELRQLQQILEDSDERRSRRRAEALLFYAAGLSAVDIARAMLVHPNTIYAYIHRFEQEGLSFAQAPCRLGLPPELTVSQVEEIVRIADSSPSEVGLPYGRWSLSKLRDYLTGPRHLLKRISREALRLVLKKKSFTSGALSANSSATTRSEQPSWPVFVRSGVICPARE
jgi:transposase